LHTFGDPAGRRPLNRQELVFNMANYLPPDDWFSVITSMFPPGLT
jgi:hypothetical protein